MEIQNASNYRQEVIDLLQSAKLPADDLPAQMDYFMVSRDGDQLSGVAGLEIYGSYALLRSVAVSQELRGKGIAAQLVSAIEEIAKAKRIKAIFLLTETAPDYFARKGYLQIARNDLPEEVKRSSEFSHVCPQSAVVMKKSIYAKP